MKQVRIAAALAACATLAGCRADSPGTKTVTVTSTASAPAPVTAAVMSAGELDGFRRK